jgi:hypothetical protein
MTGYKFGHQGDHATPEWRKSIGEDNPTGATLTTGSIARLSAVSAATLAKFDAMSAQVEVLNGKLDELRAGLDRLQAHQRDEAITKAASAAIREAQR